MSHIPPLRPARATGKARIQNALFALCCGAAFLFTAYVLYRAVFSIRTDFGFMPEEGRVNVKTCLAALPVLLGALTYVLLLVALYRFLQRHDVSERVLLLWGAGVFALFCAVYFLVAQNLSLLPYYDLSYLVSEAELLLRDGVLRPEAQEYFSVYPPTYFPMLVLYYTYKLFRVFGALDVFTAGNALSTVLTGAAVWLGFCTARRLWGTRTALVYLAAVVSNPVFYLMASWCYTDTMSVPFCMAVIYAFVRGVQSGRVRGAFGWLVVAGVCGMVGTRLRATSCVLLLAVGVWALADPAPALRKKLGMLGGMALGIGLGLAAVQGVLRTVPFVPNADLTLPVTHWFMMGLNEKSAGYWLEADFAFSTGIAGAAAKRAAIEAEILSRARGLGVWGLLSLWGEKLAVTFSSGYCLHAVDMVRSYNPLYHYSFGNSSLFVQYMCQFARSGLFALLCVATASALPRRRAGADKSACAQAGAGQADGAAGRTAKPADCAVRMLCIALLGAFAFYLLWESKPRYSYPFLLWFSLLSLPGLPALSRAWDGAVSVVRADSALRTYRVAQLVRRGGFAVMAVTLVLFLLNVRPMAQTLRFYEDPVTQQVTARHSRGVPVTQSAFPRQTFSTDDTFNELRIGMSADASARPSDVYEVVLDSTRGNLSYRHTFTVSEIKEGLVRIVLDPVTALAGAEYSFSVQPVTPHATGLFVTVHEYYDLYRTGSFSVHGQEIANADAVFYALQTSPRPITTAPVFFAIMALCLLAQLAAFTDFFHTRRGG